MPRGIPNRGAVFVATETFACEVDGVPTMVHAGQTRVRDGHPLLEVHRGYFQPVDARVTFEVEQATAAPGEKRGAPAAAKSGDVE